MKEGGADLGLGQRHLGAETRTEGLRYSWCSCIEPRGGPVDKGGMGRFRAWAKASRGRDREGGLQNLVVFLLCVWRRAGW